jgi:basic membrane lipoprotein Med (substrate-binding protein (PBP1-ABC) superfamily)
MYTHSNRNYTIAEYNNARRLAKKEFGLKISKGGSSGYLPALEDIIKNTEIVSDSDLGLVEIPLKKVNGTFQRARSTSFAKNFLPLLDEHSEFARKWCDLFEMHQNEGIRDPISVYEYLNWFYVIEGNKRVSVLKYLDAFSITGHVKRLIPKYDPLDSDIKIYYEFLEFYKVTKINMIWFSQTGSFKKLLSILLSNYSLQTTEDAADFRGFMNDVYFPFRKIYLSLSGQRLPVTTADAFLKFIDRYGFLFQITEKAHKTFIQNTIQILDEEYKYRSQQNIVEPPKIILPRISDILNPQKKLKAAFLYLGKKDDFSWNYSHEVARQKVQKSFQERVETTFYEQIDTTEKVRELLSEFEKESYDMVFSTSSICSSFTSKYAKDFPQMLFFNCYGKERGDNIFNYAPKMYEARYLLGIIAGALTKSHNIGYIAGEKIPSVLAELNAFSCGVRTTNPYCRIFLKWTGSFSNPELEDIYAQELIDQGADILSYHLDSVQTVRTAEKNHVMCMGYNYYSTDFFSPSIIANAITSWEVYYSQMIYDMLDDNWWNFFDLFPYTPKTRFFYRGLESSIVDIADISEAVPFSLQRLVKMLKKAVISKEIHPFAGPLYDSTGKLRIYEEQIITEDTILNMDWIADNIQEV